MSSKMSFFFLLFLLINIQFLSIIESCPFGCSGCNLGTLNCVQTGLKSIPLVESYPDISKISLSNELFQSNVLQSTNFTFYSSFKFIIREVSITHCNIQQIHSYTFSPLEELKILILSDNELQWIDEFAFYNLSLRLLQLDRNSKLKFHLQSLVGLRVQSLSLVSCDLETLDYRILLPLIQQQQQQQSSSSSSSSLASAPPSSSSSSIRLRSLILSNNKFTQLAFELRPLFTSFSKVDLEGNNQLVCSCENIWLNEISPKPKCLDLITNQMQLINQSLTSISCGPPTIALIQVDFLTPQLLRLTCRVNGTVPIQLQLWQLSSPRNLLNATTTTTTTTSDEGEPFVTTVNVQRLTTTTTTTETDGKSMDLWHNFTCFVSDRFGNHSSHIRVHWPEWNLIWKEKMNGTAGDGEGSYDDGNGEGEGENRDGDDNVNNPILNDTKKMIITTDYPYSGVHMLIAVGLTVICTGILMGIVYRVLMSLPPTSPRHHPLPQIPIQNHHFPPSSSQHSHSSHPSHPHHHHYYHHPSAILHHSNNNNNNNTIDQYPVYEVPGFVSSLTLPTRPGSNKMSTGGKYQPPPPPLPPPPPAPPSSNAPVFIDFMTQRQVSHTP